MLGDVIVNVSHISAQVAVNSWKNNFMCWSCQSWKCESINKPTKKLKSNKLKGTRAAVNVAHVLIAGGAFLKIQSRTPLPTDAQNFVRAWKAVIKGWHISAPLPLCVGWPEIELQGFDRQIALYTAAQAPSCISAREMDNACIQSLPIFVIISPHDLTDMRDNVWGQEKEAPEL